MAEFNAESGLSDEEEASTRNTTYCCVPQCNTYAAENVSFHYFPSNKELKLKWEVALKMGKSASKSMRVCSNHFLPTDYHPSRDPASRARKILLKGRIPSQKLPQRVHDKKETTPKKQQNASRRNRAVARSTKRSEVSTFTVEGDGPSDIVGVAAVIEPPVVVTCEMATQANLSDERPDSKDEESRSLADMLCDTATCEKATQVNLPLAARQAEGKERKKPSITLVSLLDTDEKLFTFTGIHSLDLLEGLIECASDLVPESVTNKMILSLKDRILITMVKLKLNLGFSALAVMYGISRQTVSNYFKQMCPVLGSILKFLIPWPDHETIRSNLPLSFKKYRNTRIILDCAEVTLEKSKCLKCRILSYSQYKTNFTVKFNVGVTPSGLITEISLPYGGRASDKFIVNNSGILDKLEFRDAVMVDKGYNIDKECLERYLQLIRPPFLSKKQQMGREDALENASIARARVHVERVIQRLREYKILKHTVPWRLVNYFEDILHIACGMTNLGPPIIATHRFM